MIHNFVQYTNDYEDVIINKPKIEARINKFKKNIYVQQVDTNKP